MSVLRAMYYFRTLPSRIYRVFLHLGFGIKSLSVHRSEWWRSLVTKSAWSLFGIYLIELLLLLLDLVGHGELYCTFKDIIKFNTRKLYPWEIELAKTVYGDTIEWNLISVDENAILGPRQWRFAYVSFNRISHWGVMENSLLIHEFIHVWQYQRFGSAYITRALKAQYSKQRYNYGGVPALKAAYEKQEDFLDFNFEQQGDITSDYYRIQSGYKPLWGNGAKKDLSYYEYFIEQIKNRKFHRIDYLWS